MKLGASVLSGLSASLILLPVAMVHADELPKELLLQCEGKSKLLMSGGSAPVVRDDTFNMMLRLKDRSIGNIAQSWLEGKDCVLVDGSIECELNDVKYARELNVTSKVHRTVSIKRATGEMRLFLEIWTFDGTRASGTPSSSEQLERTGVCHPANTKPIF
jgi:hypothetical protein